MYQISIYYHFIVVPMLEYIFGFSSRKKYSYIQGMHCFMELYLDNNVFLSENKVYVSYMHATFFLTFYWYQTREKIISSLITNRLNSRTQSAVYIDFVGVLTHSIRNSYISLCRSFTRKHSTTEKLWLNCP